MANIVQPSEGALAAYVLLGALVGVAAVVVTKLVYWIEDLFEHLPVHWMWWPAIGAVAVGVCGYFAPRTLGVGYYNISDILSGTNGWSFIAFLVIMFATFGTLYVAVTIPLERIAAARRRKKESA